MLAFKFVQNSAFDFVRFAFPDKGFVDDFSLRCHDLDCQPFRGDFHCSYRGAHLAPAGAVVGDDGEVDLF